MQLEKKRKRKNVPEIRVSDRRCTTPTTRSNSTICTPTSSPTSGTVKSVDGVSFDVPIGKTVGVVGESGCGKSVTSLSLMQLLQRPQGQVVEGEIRLNLGRQGLRRHEGTRRA